MTNFNSLSEAQVRKSLAFGYASPVVGLTAAFIIGAAINDLFGAFEVWTWLAIQALLGAAVIAGAHFSAIAMAANEGTGHAGASKGASRLNLVLALIWFYFVGIQSFIYGAEAISKLLDYSNQAPVLHAPSAKVWLNDFLPAQMFIILTLAGVYFFITLRSKGRKA